VSTGDEELIAAAWMTGCLESDSALMGALGSTRVWDGPAPDGTVYPILRIDSMSPGAQIVRGVGTVEVMTNQLWLVRAVDQGATFARLQIPVQRIQALLHGVTGLTVTGGTIEACVRENAFRQQIVDGGREFRHLGSIFRILVQGS
jgi:hypothetical protein